MNKFALGIVTIFIVVFSILFYPKTTTELVENNIPLPNKEINNKATYDVTISNDTLTSQDNSKSHQLTNNLPSKKIKSDFDNFLESEVFKSTQKLDDGFISSDNIISRKSVEIVFGSGDYSKLIEVVNSLDKDFISSEREDALRDQIFDLIGNKYHSEKYSCNGKLCFVEFNYSGLEVTEDQLSSISDFGSNYAFSSFSPTNDNEMTYRGLYIATDDPSTMSMSLE